MPAPAPHAVFSGMLCLDLTGVAHLFFALVTITTVVDQPFVPVPVTKYLKVPVISAA